MWRWGWGISPCEHSLPQEIETSFFFFFLNPREELRWQKAHRFNGHLILGVDCFSFHINDKGFFAWDERWAKKVIQRPGANVIFQNLRKDKIPWWLALERDRWSFFCDRMSPNPCFHSVANSSSSEIKPPTCAWLHLMESQVPGSVVAIMTSTSTAFGSKTNRWGWMLMERCEEELSISSMSEIRSLFSGFPTERELKWSFCTYFQNNRIIIIICENGPMKGVRRRSKWFRVISYMVL